MHKYLYVFWVMDVYTVYSYVDLYNQILGCNMNDDTVNCLWSLCYVKIVYHHLWLID